MYLVHAVEKRVYFVSVSKLLFVKQSLLCMLCVTLLSGCGFKLRGAYQLPAAMQTTYIEAEQPESGFVRALKRSLKSSDIQLANTASTDAALLKIITENKSKRIVSVDSRGRAREYTLNYAITFSVKAAEKNFEINEQQISIDRDFLFDTEDVLGNSRGESRLYEEMQQDLVRLIMLRLQSKA